MSFVLSQCRKPSGIVGQLVVRLMNLTHGKLTAWGLSHITVRPNDTVLDIGCGGGRTIERLTALSPNVYGVDYSSASVAAAKRRNPRADIRLASVSNLPFAQAMFDVVTAVETHYYWPDLRADVREVLRVMKPGGAFAMIGEAYRGGKLDAFFDRIPGFQVLSLDEHRDLLRDAGFADVEIFESRAKGWVCAVGRKP